MKPRRMFKATAPTTLHAFLDIGESSQITLATKTTPIFSYQKGKMVCQYSMLYSVSSENHQ